MDEDLLTVDELAAAAGTTVRTTRYYASLGLLPPPVRRGRVAYYPASHRARLELVTALRGHGFTLAAIERYLARVPADAGADELELRRTMLTSWAPGAYEELTRAELRIRAGRPIDDAALHRLQVAGGVEPAGDDRYAVLPAFDVAVQMLDLDIPLDGLVEAAEAITRHMDALAGELTAILRRRVLEPYRTAPGTDPATFRATLQQLRRLTAQAVLHRFEQAADRIIARTVGRG